jgi:flagellar L-ring protein precursor FlgH
MLLSMVLVLTGLAAVPKTKGKPKPVTVSPIDRMIADAERNESPADRGTAMGSIYSSAGLLGDTYRDLRASRIDDILTILVSDRASAISKGTTAAQRKSSASAGIKSIAGKSIPSIADLASLSGSQDLQAQGSTGRESTLDTTLTVRVTKVLPNGSLVVEGDKEVSVNSERQFIHVRGVVRTFDITTANTVRSDRVANLEIQVNGKGVVGDAIRRPNILYRILMGILPF